MMAEMFSSMPVDPQADEDRRRRQKRDRQDGEGHPEALVEKEQQQKDQDHGGDEDHHEPLEGDLLLPVEPAEFVVHPRGEQLAAPIDLFHVADRRTEVAAADAGGYRHHALEVLRG